MGWFSSATKSVAKRAKSNSSSNSSNNNSWQSGAINKVVNSMVTGGRNARSSEYEYMDQINEQYAELQRQQEAAKRAAIEQGVNRLEGNRSNINQGYDDAARQAYVQKMQNQQALPQQLAGQGIQGGGTESAQIALDTSYGSNIASNEKSRQNALSGLDNAITDLRNTGDISIADSRLALQQQQLQDYQNNYYQKLQQDNWQKQFDQGQRSNDMQMYQNTIGAYGNDYQAQINNLRSGGVTDDDYRVKMLMSARNDKLQNQQQSYPGTIGAYSNDYQAEINRLLSAGVSKDDYRIKALMAARNEKIAAMQQAEAEQRQQDFENQIDWGRYQYDTGKPYYKPKGR